MLKGSNPTENKWRCAGPAKGFSPDLSHAAADGAIVANPVFRTFIVQALHLPGAVGENPSAIRRQKSSLQCSMRRTLTAAKIQHIINFLSNTFFRKLIFVAFQRTFEIAIDKAGHQMVTSISQKNVEKVIFFETCSQSSYAAAAP